MGITYYPDRWWALAIPAWAVMLIVFIYVSLQLYNLEVLTKPLGSVETVVDDAAQIAVVDKKGRIKDGGRVTSEKTQAVRDAGQLAVVWTESTDAVMDIPLGAVCEVLYRKED